MVASMPFKLFHSYDVWFLETFTLRDISFILWLNTTQLSHQKHFSFICSLNFSLPSPYDASIFIPQFNSVNYNEKIFKMLSDISQEMQVQDFQILSWVKE